MKYYLNKKFLLGFVVSILILAALGVSSFLYIGNVIDLSRKGARENHILFLSERIRSLTTEREGIRRERDSPNEANLKSYSDLSASIESVLQNLILSTREDSAQQKNVGRLQREIANRNRLESLRVEERMAWTTSHPDSTKFFINKIQSIESSLRVERQALATEQFYQFVLAFFGLVILGLIVPITLAIALNNNLRERTKAEEKLSSASQTIHDLYENAPCGYFSLNADGIIIHANKTLLSLLGYSKEEVVDRMLLESILPADERSHYKSIFSTLKEKGQIQAAEFHVVKKDKLLLAVSINGVSIHDKNYNFISSRCTLFDITELKRAESETNKANLELESFSYSVSHDLRAPLRSINGFARILKEDYGSAFDEEANRLLGKIITNANRMGQLIDDLLSFSRLGKKEIKKGEVDLDIFVAGIANELIDQEKGRAIRINTDPLGKCFADQSMLQQVWVNLISNALKYTRKNGEANIQIGVMEKDGEKVFYVKDNGVGFDMQFSDKIFGVFQRLHRMEDFEGTGVGLALVKRIVERHHGRIWFEAAVNQGATFYFTMGDSVELKPIEYAVDR